MNKHNKPKKFQKLFTILIIVSYISLTYIAHIKFWLSSTGLVFILFFAWLKWGNDFLLNTGFRIHAKHIPKIVLILFVTASTSFLAIKLIASNNEVKMISFFEAEGNYRNIFHTFFQCMNEEVILGYILLSAICNKFPRQNLLFISVFTALLFTFFHLAFYGFRPPDIINYGWLSVTTLISLLAVGIIRNNLILSTGHIGYSWAIHYGWNLIFFDSFFTRTETGNMLNEPERFNLLLGNGLMTTITMVVAILITIFYRRQLYERKMQVTE